MRRKLMCYVGVLFFVFSLAIWANPEPASAAQKINLNTAPIEKLQELKGIGPTIAQRIVDYREKHPFESKEEVKEVKGIGEKTYQEIKDQIMVE